MKEAAVTKALAIVAVSVLASACALEVPPLAVTPDASVDGVTPDAVAPDAITPDVTPPRDVAVDRGPAPCPEGQVRCAGRCVALASDPDHCGACDRRCASGICRAGQCVDAVTCDEGTTRCGGRCVDTRASATHCGACGVDCGHLAGSDGACVASRCRCAPGQADCDGDAANGCETSVYDNAAHCGACGARCDGSHGVLACEGGACAVRGCAPGWGDCDGDGRNGCEAPLTTAERCGACGMTCPPADHASPVCVVGTLLRCDLVCEVGFASCDGHAANGCEADLSRSFRHCGGCNRPCNGTCVGGVCL